MAPQSVYEFQQDRLIDRGTFSAKVDARALRQSGKTLANCIANTPHIESVYALTGNLNEVSDYTKSVGVRASTWMADLARMVKSCGGEIDSEWCDGILSDLFSELLGSLQNALDAERQSSVDA